MTRPNLKRRSLLRTAAAALTAGPSGCGQAKGQELRTQAGLAAIAARHGGFYGAATGSRLLAQDASLARAFAAECGLLVPEREAKWDPVPPALDRYDFFGLDRLAAFTEAHGMLFRGHCLVWHRGVPDWLPEALRAGDPRATLEGYVATVLGRYRGRVHSWDVVNEAVQVNAPGRLRSYIRAAAALGLEVYVTELDLTDRDLPADEEGRDRAAADLVRAYLGAALAEPAVKGVVTWGLSDRYSWLDQDSAHRRSDGARTRGLPLDDGMRRKPMWHALADALAGAP